MRRLLLLSLLALCPLFAQTAKIDPRLRSAAPGDRLQVFVLLREQPQRLIYERAAAATSWRRRVLEDDLARQSKMVRPDTQAVAEGRRELDSLEIGARQAAAAGMKAAVQRAQDLVEARLKALGATGVTRFFAVNMLAAEVPAESLDALAADPDVAEIFPRLEYRTEVLGTILSLNAPFLWEGPFSWTGRGETVAVLDTGIRSTHPAFNGVELDSQVFLRDASASDCFSDLNDTGEDRQGHGTHVSGIVAGQPITGFENHYGVAPRLGKLVSVKVGFRTRAIQGRCADGQGSFADRDILSGLEYVLTQTSAKIINCSFGADIPADDDPQSRIFDRLADVFGVTFVIAAGNSGPRASTVGTPGLAYNAITVANMDIRRTADRADDAVNPSSSRGPTRGGRFKPDLAAPGTNVFAADYASNVLVSKTGTSMASPAVAGAAALLRQGGVTDPLALKATLINSSEGDGWKPDAGWGYLNLQKVPEHTIVRSEIPPASVRYFRGTLGTTLRATLTWNRHPFEDARTTPVFHDLDLALYTRVDNTRVSISDSGQNNVEQVLARGGAAAEMVLKVIAVNERFGGGLTAEPYALAISQKGWTAVEGPRLSVECQAPASVAPSAALAVTCTAANQGQLEAFRVNLGLRLPAGFTAIDPFVIGTIAPGAAVTRTFTIQAPAASVDAELTATAAGVAFDDTVAANSTIRLRVGGGGPTTPVLTAAPTALTFRATAGGAAPAPAPLEIRSSGGAASFTALTSEGWLRVTPANGTAPATLQVTATPGSLPAGTHTGAVTLTADGLPAPVQIAVSLIVAASSTPTVKVEERLMARSVDFSQGCTKPAAVTSFVASDRQARLWFLVSGVKAGDRPLVEWYGPSGSLFQSTPLTSPDSDGTWCFAPGLDLASIPEATRAGNWRARVLWNGGELFVENFSVTGLAQVINRMIAGAIPENQGCALPNAQTEFRTSDDRVYLWYLVGGYKPGDQPTVEWVSPNGETYREALWNPTPDSTSNRCYWDSIEIANIDAGVREGRWTVRVKWNGSVLFSLPFTIAPPVDVERRLMTKAATSELSCSVPPETSAFLPGDATAALWFNVARARKGDVVKADWISPDGETYTTMEWDPLDEPGNWCLWGWIEVSGTDAATKTGRWKARVSWNGTPVFTQEFSIAPAALEGARMTKELRDPLCDAPDAVSGFLTTDPRAALWFLVRGAKPGDRPRVEWYSPDGSRFRAGQWEPLSEEGDYCFTSTLSIADSGPAERPGQWRSRVIWNDSELFEIPFRIDPPQGASAAEAAQPQGEAEAPARIEAASDQSADVKSERRPGPPSPGVIIRSVKPGRGTGGGTGRGRR
ncbi:MAG: S8 family serine peptidase [Bryobacteraceae bacterium]|nr:S8 family serine peptidase [Bryobacteraceae bacterium]